MKSSKMSSKDAAEVALLIGAVANIALVTLFMHLRREASVYVVSAAMVPGLMIVFGMFIYIESGHSLTEAFWWSGVVLLVAVGKIFQMKRNREYVREHYPAIRRRHKNYWKKRIRSEQDNGNDLLLSQKSGRLPGNDELLSCGYDKSELTELGLLD